MLLGLPMPLSLQFLTHALHAPHAAPMCASQDACAAPMQVHLSHVVSCMQGRPVYIQLLGQIDIAEMKRVTTEERMIKFHIQVRRQRHGHQFAAAEKVHAVRQ